MIERVIDLGKHVEDSRHLIGADANAIIANANDGIGSFAIQLQDDAPASIHIPRRIAEKVGHDLRQPYRISIHIQWRGMYLGDQVVILQSDLWPCRLNGRSN